MCFSFGQIYTLHFSLLFYLLTNAFCNFEKRLHSNYERVMKNRGSVFLYARERDDDLMRAYNEQIDKCETIYLPHVFSRVVKMPSKRFWVSPDRAAIVISAMMNGDKLTTMRPTKRLMYEEIYRRVMELKRIEPNTATSLLVYRVIQEPAPEFYLTAGSAKVIICKARKQWCERRMRRFRRLRSEQ